MTVSAIVGGLLGAGLVAAIWAAKTKGELEARAAALGARTESPDELQRLLASTQTSLQRYGRQLVETTAEASAKRVLADRYGLTAARAQQLQTLVARFT